MWLLNNQLIHRHTTDLPELNRRLRRAVTLVWDGPVGPETRTGLSFHELVFSRKPKRWGLSSDRLRMWCRKRGAGRPRSSSHVAHTTGSGCLGCLMSLDISCRGGRGGCYILQGTAAVLTGKLHLNGLQRHNEENIMQRTWQSNSSTLHRLSACDPINSLNHSSSFVWMKHRVRALKNCNRQARLFIQHLSVNDNSKC